MLNLILFDEVEGETKLQTYTKNVLFLAKKNNSTINTDKFKK